MPQTSQRTQRKPDKETRRPEDKEIRHRRFCSLSPWLLVCLSLCVLCGGALYFTKGAAAAPVVVPVDGERFVGKLVAVAADGAISFRRETSAGEAGSEVRALRRQELVRWGHPVLPRAQTWVLLADGSRLVAAADWSGGAPVRTEGDEFVVVSDAFDEVRVSREQVRGLVFAQSEHRQERERLVEIVRSSTAEQDEVLLTNEDRIAGELVAMDRGSLNFRTERGDVKLPLSRAEAVILAGLQASGGSPEFRRQAPREGVGSRLRLGASIKAESRQSQKTLDPVRSVEPSPNPSLQGREMLVGLRDGSLLYAKSIEGDEEELVVELAGGLRFEDGSIDEVVFLQSLGGERLVYLSDLEPVDYRHVPYLAIEWPWRRDENVSGGPLVAGGERYLKGIGMHSAARLVYQLDEKYQRFDAALAVDDSARRRGSVTFGVYVLREDEWQEAHKSGIVRGGDAPLPISVDVSGAEGLTLMVDYADHGDELDRADWLDARLVPNF
jgi:NPCBM/NEW2 domain